jgi:hypothetical protein
MASTDNQVEAALGSAEVTPVASNQADRRTFMTSAVTVATAAVAATSAAGAPLEKQDAPAKVKLQGSVNVRFDVKKHPTAKELHATLDRILTLHGCPTCGLGGIDIRFRLGAPVERLEVKGPAEVTLEKAATP